jgi:hypothetical protein
LWAHFVVVPREVGELSEVQRAGRRRLAFVGGADLSEDLLARAQPS